ncbi:tetratricopeptide repeat protein [Actinosynnema sp. NPDC059335]|uniref:AfsR/SARP family transcriptional regulator n=1 Tax=Actinosynnema sp. NPDC059335 TaxID=3346804 RepID=UPI00366F3CE5
MEFKIIGPTRLHIDGKDHDLGPAQQRGVLTMLLYEFPRSVHIDVIARVLWPDTPVDQVKRRLQPIVSRLRGILRDSRSGGYIVKEGNAYRLTLESADMIDFHRFRKLAEAGRVVSGRGDHSAARTLLREALSLWSGRPLHELEGGWADHHREQVDNFDLLPAMHVLLDSLYRLGEYWEVVAEAGRLIATRPPNEYFAGLYMRSLDALGRYSAALEFYEDFRERLLDHVGAEPGPELRAVNKNLLRKQASAAAPPHQIPPPTRSFTGREDLLERLDALLETGGPGQVVALHGMPTVGKSALALKWASRQLHRFPDGNLRLELRGFSAGTPLAPDDALAGLLRSLGAERIPATGDERQAELRRILGDRRMLILLDDVQTSAQVRPVLAATPNCFTIITSRTRLMGLKVRDHVDLIRVPPLSTEESIVLLRNEIGHARSDREPAAVHELATVVDGLPLGLHIIGQHIANRPAIALAELVDEFKEEEGLGVLGSVHDSDDESVTLPVAFSWSFRDLPPDAARVFRLLGLNPTAEFGVATAAALLGEDEAVVSAHLGVLVRSNLVEHGGPRRYRLHDMLHGYAVDLVRHQESAHARKLAMTRLLDWYLASAGVAARLLDPQSSPPPALDGMVTRTADLADDTEALAWLTRERANLVAAVPMAVRHGFHEHAWRLAANFYEAYDRSEQFEDVLVSLRAALKAAAALGNGQALAGTHSDLGTALYRLKRYSEAQHHFEAGMAIAQRVGADQIYAVCLHNLASTRLAQGELGTAVELYREILDAARASGDRNGEAYALDQLANAYEKAERDDLALVHHYGALAIRREIGHIRGEATTLTELGALHHSRGEQEEALRRLAEALELLPLSGDRVRTGQALLTIAEVEYDMGRFADAIAHCEQAVAVHRATGFPEHHGRVAHLWGHASVGVHDYDSAERLWSQSVELLRGVVPVEADLVREHLADLRRIREAVPSPRTPDLTGVPSREVAERRR